MAPWDLLHCPPRVAHTIVAAGDQPALVFAVGARKERGSARYPVESAAIRRGAGVGEPTATAVAYARFSSPAIGPPPPEL